MMAPNKIKRSLLRRLSYLEVSLEDGHSMSEGCRGWREDERDALQSALERLGLFDEERLREYKERTRERFTRDGAEEPDASSAA